jgi:hypothetical protein
MARKFFLERITPAADRWRAIDWPFAVGDSERPRVAVLVLGGDAMEAVTLAVGKHFAGLARAEWEAKLKAEGKAVKGAPPASGVKMTDAVWADRERAEVIYRAFRELGDDGKPSERPLAASADDIMAQAPQVRDLLYSEWCSIQSEVAPPRYTQKDLDDLVEHLKKNSPSATLSGLPSTLLIALITTLVGQLTSSTKDT